MGLLRPGRINNRATLKFRESGNRVRCIGSNPSGAHGLRVVEAIPPTWVDQVNPTSLAEGLADAG